MGVLRRILRWLWPWRRKSLAARMMADKVFQEHIRAGLADLAAGKIKLVPAEAWLAPPVLHLVTHPENRPICGASIKLPWTEDPAAATCPKCKRDGEMLAIQYQANNR